MKTVQIGLPRSPATVISNTLLGTTRVKVSPGGNMIYTKADIHYATKTERGKIPGDLWKLTLITGEQIEVNPTFIVDAIPCRVVHLVTDVTAWANYYKHTCTRHVITEYIVLEHGDDYVVTNAIRSGNNLHIIKTYDTITK